MAAVRPGGLRLRLPPLRQDDDVIVGVGLDVVPLQRFTALLRRRPVLLGRLFTAAELADTDRVPERLAVRFAAKEAMAKALGAPGGLRWQDAQVRLSAAGAPRLSVTGTVARRANVLGVDAWHVSLSHDAGVAVAVVIAEGGLP
jgi:holo-[acyl-carrier protein] synthase